jgi:DNA-directed RNA polymerase subunit K/omega
MEGHHASGEAYIVMAEETEGRTEATEQEKADEEIARLRSKYERVMLAAAEATRLNEEIRRKGIKVDTKIATEAIRRVAEGKVKGVFPERGAPPEAEPGPSPETPRETLFSTPPSEDEAAAPPPDDDTDKETEKD